jgi:hypothetical protein
MRCSDELGGEVVGACEIDGSEEEKHEHGCQQGELDHAGSVVLA